MMRMTAPEQLAAIAALVEPCPPPDVWNGYDLCVCGRGQVYPCDLTVAAWLARGLDPEVEQRCEIDATFPADPAELADDSQRSW